MIVCSNCGTENDLGRKFCIECASRLGSTCPNCGTSNPPAAKFCGECATQLAGASPARNPTAPARHLIPRQAETLRYTQVRRTAPITATMMV